MRYIAILFFVILPAVSFAQSQKDYERMVGRFMKFYNQNQPDSICNLFSDTWGAQKKSLWSTAKNDELVSKYGNMNSYKFVEVHRDGTGDGGGDGLAYFKVVFTKSTHIMGITLNKQNELLTFRFKTSSPHIDSLLLRN